MLTCRMMIERLATWMWILFAAAGCAADVRGEAPTVLTGRWHKISQGDTLQSVAAIYGADTKALAELNDLADDRAMASRREIFVPMISGKAPGADGPKTAAEATPSAAEASGSKTAASPKTPRSCKSLGNPCLAWPLSGKLGAGFGVKNNKPHDGIDILAKKGTPVRAAADGEVLYSGAQIKGYGNLIILRHKGDIITVYAHNDKNIITEGARVTQGDIIAEVGRSGNATVDHLHFEVRVAEVPKDPVDYLPAKP